MPVCYCEKHFQTTSGFRKHKMKCEVYIKSMQNLPKETLPGNTHCLEPNCNLSFKYIKDLRDHLQDKHKVILHLEDIEFECYLDFLAWKHEYEKLKICSFTRVNKVRKNSTVEYFYCNRSGSFSNIRPNFIINRKRKQKFQGSAKINNNCTASITATMSNLNSTVNARVCHTHYGHKNDLRYLSLSIRGQLKRTGNFSKQAVPAISCSPTQTDAIDTTPCILMENVNVDSEIQLGSEVFVDDDNIGNDVIIESIQPDLDNQVDIEAVVVDIVSDADSIENMLPVPVNDLQSLKFSLLQQLTAMTVQIRLSNNVNELIAVKNHIDSVDKIFQNVSINDHTYSL